MPSKNAPPKKASNARHCQRIVRPAVLFTGAGVRSFGFCRDRPCGRGHDCLGFERAQRSVVDRSPYVRPELPKVKDVAWAKTPIDRFILAGLEDQGLAARAGGRARSADSPGVFRSVGSAADARGSRERSSPTRRRDAYERLVDRLLASPHYGERWARYWLDLVRFAETNGYERDALKPNAWQYRDWVIRALNDDKPYDRFVLEQLAGDELPDANDETRIATGFLRVGTSTTSRTTRSSTSTSSSTTWSTPRARPSWRSRSSVPAATTTSSIRFRRPTTTRCLNFFIGGKAAEGPLLAYTDAGPQAPAVQLLQGGDPTQPGATSCRRLICRCCRAWHAPSIRPPPTPRRRGRRTQLAHWITDRAQSAHRAGDGQSALAASFRRGAGAHARQFWHAGQPADASANCSIGWPAN